jgi:hypothetical protein
MVYESVDFIYMIQDMEKQRDVENTIMDATGFEVLRRCL